MPHNSIMSFHIEFQDDGSYPLHVAVISGNEELLQILAAYYDSVGKVDVRNDVRFCS